MSGLIRKQKKKKINHLEYFSSWYSTECTHSIDCTKCGRSGFQDTCDEDPTEILEYWYSKGWRVTDKNCYCPACRKKYLKK